MGDRSVGWRIPALGVALVLVALVAIGRSARVEPLTAQHSLEPSTTPSQPPITVLVPREPPSPVATMHSRWPDRYADGIPRSAEGRPVLRLNAALNAAAASPARRAS